MLLLLSEFGRSTAYGREVSCKILEEMMRFLLSWNGSPSIWQSHCAVGGLWEELLSVWTKIIACFSPSRTPVRYSEGVPGLIKKDIAKALEYYKKAADLSRQLPCPGEHSSYASSVRATWRVKADYPTAVKYATLASHYATGKDDSTAASVLGLFFQDGNGLTSSLTLATH